MHLAQRPLAKLVHDGPELAGPKHERALIRRPALYGAEQVTINGDLKDVFWSSRVRQLGIPRLVGPSPAWTAVLNAYKEIGVAEPRTCRKGRLIDQGNAALHRVDRGGEACLQRPGWNLNRIAVPLLQPQEACGFMLMTLSDDKCGLRIVGGLSGSAQASTSFQGPRGRCVAPEESRRECGRKARQAVIRIV